MQRWLFVSLVLWGIGAQTLEGLSTTGLVFTLIGVLAMLWRRRSLDRVQQALLTWWPLVAFMGWALLMPLLGGRTPDGGGVGRLADWLGLPAAVVAFRAITPRQQRRLAKIVAATFTVSCAIAGLQYLGWWPPLEAFQNWRWTGLPFARVYEPSRETPGRFMGGGLLFHRLKFAHVGGLVVAGAFALGWTRTGRDRALAWGVAAFGLLSILVFASARGAALSLFAASIPLLLLTRPQLKHVLVGGAAFSASLGGIFLLTPTLWHRFTQIFDSGSNGDRSQIWAAGWRAVRRSPVSGVGLGRFRLADFVTENAPKNLLEHGGRAHNQFLTYAAEIGIPGTLLFLGLLVWLAARLRGPRGGPGLALIYFFVALALVHDPLFHAQFSMGFVLALGVALALTERQPAESSTSHERPH